MTFSSPSLSSLQHLFSYPPLSHLLFCFHFPILIFFPYNRFSSLFLVLVFLPSSVTYPSSIESNNGVLIIFRKSPHHFPDPEIVLSYHTISYHSLAFSYVWIMTVDLSLINSAYVLIPLWS